MLEMVRLLVAHKYKGVTAESIKKFHFSRTSEIIDGIRDLLVDPEFDEYTFAEDSIEMQQYQDMFAGLAQRYGGYKN